MTHPALAFVEDALSKLEHSAREREGDLRNIQLATVAPDGRPGLRTLVLRDISRRPPVAEMHSDARADKVRDIARSGAVVMLAWSPEDHLQLRFEGTARLHRDDDVARERWDSLSEKARNTYGSRAVPGTHLDDPSERTLLPTDQQFQQFTVILITLERLDVLRLAPDGDQARAAARFTETGIEAEWIEP